METLPCCLIKLTSEKTSVEVTSKPWRKLIYIHPKTMSQHEYHFRQPLIINSTLLFYAWPNKSMNANFVGFTNEYFKSVTGVAEPKKDLSYRCSVVPLKVEDIQIITTCLVTTTSSNDYKILKLIDYSFLDKAYLHEMESFKINYLGRDVTLTFHINPNSDASIDNTSNETIDKSSEVKEAPTFFQFTSNTKILFKEYDPHSDGHHLKLDDLGGMMEVKQVLMHLVKVHLIENSCAASLKNIFPKSCLLVGPSGLGKTAVVHAIALHHNIPIIHLTTLSFNFMYAGDRKKKMDSTIAQICGPTIIFVDNLQSLPQRKKSISDNLNSFLNDLTDRNDVIILGATNKIEALDPKLLNSKGIFNFIHHVYPPTALERLKIILKQFNRLDINPGFDESEIKDLAYDCHGYSGADLYHACAQVKNHMRMNDDKIDKTLVLKIFHQTVPSVMKEIAIKNPQVAWQDIGGREDLKKTLDMCIHLPISQPEIFKRLGIKPPRGILLFGPPGCSKTMLAKALATESKLNFLSVQGSGLHGMYVGETERAIRNLFMRARSAAPSIIFFDEIEAFAVQRGRSTSSAGSVDDRAVQQLLTEIDGITGLKDVFIIAATNRPDLIDPAFMRPGRFDRCIYVPLPDMETRRQLLITKVNKTFKDVGEMNKHPLDIEMIVQLTGGYSCAELSNVIDDAFMLSMREDIQNPILNMQHILRVISTTNPVTTKEVVAWYEEYCSKFSH